MNKKRIATYLFTTFAITYTFWWGLALMTNLGIIHSSQGIFTLLHAIGGFGPTIAAILTLPKRSPKTVAEFVFSRRKGSIRYLILFCAIQALVIAISSGETNPALPWYFTPIVMLSATFVGGGNEELGWRGIMQPELEKAFPFPIATLITWSVWMAWHIPLWFVIGAPQQSMNFCHYCIFGLVLSFWLTAIYKKTNCVFFCSIFHGCSNLLLSFFVIKVNPALVVGLLLSLAFSIRISYKAEKQTNTADH